LMAISERHNIPLVETHAGKSTVEFQFKNNLGGTGILGTSAANAVIRNADLVIGIGTRYTDFTTSSKTAFNWEETRFLNINVSRPQAYKLDAYQVVADARATLELLADRLDDYKTAYGSELERLKAEWLTERERLANVTFDRTNFDPEIKGQFTQEIFNEYAEALNTE
ncbi:3D-(3,5/4)-trihydroxycyclohexane-1,2-dione acylhydrolase (decyclizing), partial [Listeria sp. FSL L7-0091]|nr:3D-(3,5/4)-trihydroxycyclohexane-1,2-dione acylhydrolase (decyclizing) [Listeria farberi]